VNGNVKLGRAAARSGEWAQHFSNASCLIHLTASYVGIVCEIAACSTFSLESIWMAFFAARLYWKARYISDDLYILFAYYNGQNDRKCH